MNRWKEIGSIFVQLLAVLAIFMPVFGPIADHHFFEKLTFHSHLYTGEIDPEHSHSGTPDRSDSQQKYDGFIAGAPDGLFGHSSVAQIDLGNTGYGLSATRYVVSHKVIETTLSSDAPYTTPDEPPKPGHQFLNVAIPVRII